MAEYKDLHSSSPALRTPKLQLSAKQPLTGEHWIPPKKKNTPRPGAKEKLQQDGRRGEITFRIKPLTPQRHSEGSNEPFEHQDPETLQLSQNCLSVSCRDMGQQWPAAGTGALGAADLGMTYALLQEVAINPTIEPPELTQEWGNRLLEGTNRTLN